MNANRVTVNGSVDGGVFGDVTEDPPEVPSPRENNWKQAMLIAKLGIVALKLLSFLLH